MEFLQLTYFCAAARNQNFSLTAKQFGVPPSDISQSIKRLEAELSTPLFDRSANRIRLNSCGAVFYEKASEALALLDDAKREAIDNGRQADNRIRICVNTNRRVVMQAIEKFKRLSPGTEIIAQTGPSRDGEEFALIVTADDVAISAMVREKLLAEEISLAVCRTAPLAMQACSTPLDRQALAGEVFITMNENHSLCRITRQICADLGFTPHIAMQSDDPHYVRKCVELGLGVAFVPSISWRGQLADNIVLLPMPSYRRETYVYYRDGRYMTRCTRDFLALLRQEFSAEAKK